MYIVLNIKKNLCYKLQIEHLCSVYLQAAIVKGFENAGWAVAVTKGLLGQVEGLVAKFSSTLYSKKCHDCWVWRAPGDLVFISCFGMD